MDFLSIAFLLSMLNAVLGNRADAGVVASFRSLQRRLRREIGPGEDALLRAARRAVMTATVTLCDAYATNDQRERQDRRWVREVRGWARREARRASGNSWQPSISPSGTTAAESEVSPADGMMGPIGVLRPDLERIILAELMRRFGSVPAEFEQMLHQGWARGADGTTASWFDTACSHFLTQMKTHEPLRAAFEVEILAQLNLTTQEFDSLLRGTEERVGSRLDEITAVLTRLLNSYEELTTELAVIESAVQDRLDGWFPRFVLATGTEELERIEQGFGAALARCVNRYEASVSAGRVEELLDRETRFFTGRDGELEHIDNWIESNRSGILTLTAPAGYGKTALLAEWVRTGGDPGTFVAYHFFSERDPEHLASWSEAMGNLLRQLRSYYSGDAELPPAGQLPAENVIYGLLDDYGARPGERLVIVLDALDEAEGSPRRPPVPDSLREGVFLVVSARAEKSEPIATLRWADRAEHVMLPLMNDQDVGAYLTRLGTLTEDQGLVRELMAKVQGYPLYLRYLAEDIEQAQRDRRDPRAQLRTTARGFIGYVDAVLDQMARDTGLARIAWRVLAGLAAAAGPLTTSDLKGAATLDDVELRIALNSPKVSRWIRSSPSADGDELSLDHPALREAFGSQMGDETARARRGILKWCSNWRVNQSNYALRHYSTHLLWEVETDRSSQALDTLLAITHDQQFRQEQKARIPGDPTLSLRTTEHALRAAIALDHASAMAALALAYARESAALSAPLDETDLQAGWRLADLAGPGLRDLHLLLLAWRQDEIGDANGCQLTLDRISASDLGTPQEWSPVRDWLLNLLLINADWQNGDDAATLDDLGEQVTDKQQQETVELAAIRLAGRGDIKGAKDALARITDDIGGEAASRFSVARTFASARVWRAAVVAAQRLAEAGAAERAISVAEEIEDAEHKSIALARIAPHVARSLGAAAGEQVISAARTLADDIGHEYVYQKVPALAAVAQALALTGRRSEASDLFAEARTAALITPGIQARARVVCDVAEAESAVGSQSDKERALAQAQEIAELVEPAFQRVEALTRVAWSQLDASLRDSALATLATAAEAARQVIPEFGQRTTGFILLANLHLALGLREEAEKDADEAGRAALLTRSSSERAERGKAFREVAEFYRQIGKSDEARRLIATGLRGLAGTGSLSGANALLSLAATLRQQGRKDQASEALVQAARWSELIESEASKLEVSARIAAEWAPIDHDKSRALFESVELALRDVPAGFGRRIALSNSFAIMLKAGYLDTLPAWCADDEDVAEDFSVRLVEAKTEAGSLTDAHDAVASISSDSGRARALRHIATAELRAGDIDQAQRTFEEAAGYAARTDHGNRVRVAALATQAESLARAGDQDAAERLLATCRDAAGRISRSEQRSLALLAIAQAESNMGDHPHGRASYLAASEVAADHGTLLAVALAQADAGLIDDARATLRRAQQAAESFAERGGAAAEVLARIAETQGRLDPAESEALFDAARVAADRIPDPEQRAIALAEVAQAHARAGQSSHAVETFSAALDTADRIRSPRQRGRALRHIGLAQASAHQLDAALATLHAARQEAEKSTDALVRSQALAALGYVHLLRGDHASSHDAFQQARVVARPLALAPSDDFRRALESISTSLAEAGAIEEARALVREDLASIDQYLIMTAIDTVVGPKANALAQEGQFEEAISIIKDMRASWLIADALTEVGKAAARAGDEEVSKRVFDVAIKWAHEESQGNHIRAEAAIAIGAVLGSRSLAAEAKAHFDTAARYAGSDIGGIEVLIDLARAENSAGLTKDASFHLDRAALLASNQADRYRSYSMPMLAAARTALGHVEVAVSYADAVHDPGLAQSTLAAVASELIDEGRSSEAFEVISRLPTNAPTLPSLVRSLARAGDRDTFKKVLPASVGQLESALEACAQIGLLYPEEADEVVASLTAFGPMPRPHFHPASRPAATDL